MNCKFKIFIFMFFVIALMPSKAYASRLIVYSDIDKNKNWIINFTNNILLDDSIKNGIKVQDDSGNTISVNYKLGLNGKSIIVKAPLGGYTPGECYTLSIGTSIHSTDGKSLKEQVNLFFDIDTIGKTVPYLPLNYDNIKEIKLIGGIKGAAVASEEDTKKIVDWINSIKNYKYRKFIFNSCPPPVSSIYIIMKSGKNIEISYGYSGCTDDTLLIGNGYYVTQPELQKYMSNIK